MPQPLQPLSGKVILICGAGADQARLAAELDALGATLAITAADPVALGALALPLNALPLPADPADPEDCIAVVDEVIDSLDRLDVIAGADSTGFAAVATERGIPCRDITCASITALLV